MVVGLCHITLILHGNHSLKGKRMVLRKVVDGVRSRFNVAVSEVGAHDLWQRAELGIAAVGNEKPAVNSALDKVVDYIEGLHAAEVARVEMEFTDYSTD